ncbi:hypothetical protein MCUN1_002775 [Malassezia cuniculi]|uniref:Phosphatidic acid phosphatase type 2/haloperoxidase domain-containing protein n=1 Tax=Malassezia cuniculi TaxID=948313 RepID=A0AAF0EX37_9BASI|nr:hypothetical protein MCUN1_002775 [Malassezia cuniculi]
MGYSVSPVARVKRHAFDWGLLIVLIIVLCVLVSRDNGFRREFSLTDTSIQHPYAEKERVPSYALVLISLIAPLVLVIVLPAGLDKPIQRMHYGVLGLAITYCLNGTITNIIKLCAGRPRPDLLDRCKPNIGMVNVTQNAYHSTLVTDSICTVPLDSSTLSDGFKSFPSGHSSSTFAGMVYLGLYFRHILWHYGQRFMRNWRAPEHNIYSSSPDVSDPIEPDTALLRHEEREDSYDRSRSFVLLGTTVQLLLLLVAFLVAVSRTMDYRHHATDVLAGGIIGTVVALFIFHVYHPLALPRFEQLH